MFAISKRSDAPVRVTLVEAQGDDPAAIVILVPIDPAMRRRATRRVRTYMERLGVEPAAAFEGDLLYDVGEQVSRELLRLGIVEIEGIVDADTKAPFVLTPDRETRLRTSNDEDRPTGTIDDLLADERVFGMLDAAYVIPDALRRAEKNGLSGSPNGTSAAATPGSDTANSHARATKAGAKSAPIQPKRSKRSKRKASGTS